MEQIPEIVHWTVDLEHPDKLLTVKAQDEVAQKILRALQEAGYTGQIVVDA